MGYTVDISTGLGKANNSTSNSTAGVACFQTWIKHN
jgi:hypothetical protein